MRDKTTPGKHEHRSDAYGKEIVQRYNKDGSIDKRYNRIYKQSLFGMLSPFIYFLGFLFIVSMIITFIDLFSNERLRAQFLASVAATMVILLSIVVPVLIKKRVNSKIPKGFYIFSVIFWLLVAFGLMVGPPLGTSIARFFCIPGLICTGIVIFKVILPNNPNKKRANKTPESLQKDIDSSVDLSSADEKWSENHADD